MKVPPRKFAPALFFLAFALGTVLAFGQHWDGNPSGVYGPGAFTTPADPPTVEPDEFDPYVNFGFMQGFFFRYDAVFALMTPPATTTVGDPSTTYLIPHAGGGFVSATASIDTSWIEPKGGWGDRFEFGRQFQEGGWMVSVLNVEQRQKQALNGALVVFADPQATLIGFRDVDADGIDDDEDGDGIYGSSGQDTDVPRDGVIDAPAAPDADDLYFYLPTYSYVEMTASTQLTGVEWMEFRTFGGYRPNVVWDVFYGARFLKVIDRFHFTGYGGPLDTTDVDTVCDNYLMGPQVGARWTGRWQWVLLSLEARGFPAYNLQQTQQVGTIATSHTAGSHPTQLYANSFSSAFEEDQFSPVAEWRAELLLEFWEGVSFRMGYTGMYIGGISRAAPKVKYELPNWGLLDVDNDDGVWVNAFNLGFELAF